MVASTKLFFFTCIERKVFQRIAGFRKTNTKCTNMYNHRFYQSLVRSLRQHRKPSI